MWQCSRLIGFSGILATLLAFSTGDLFAQKKNKGKPQDLNYPATDAEYAQIKNVKELSGTLLTIDGSSKILTIRVEIPHMEPNPKYKPKTPKLPKAANTPAYQQAKLQYDMTMLYQDIAKQQQIAQTAKTPQQRQNAMNKLQLDMYRYQDLQARAMKTAAAAYGTPGVGAYPAVDPNNAPFITVTAIKDYTLDLKEVIIVRKLFLPMEYDDTGNIKKYTDKEKEELKGKDKKLPGYEAKIDELLPTQEVKIYLTPPPPAKAKKKDEKKKDAKDAKDDDNPPPPPMEASDHPTVNMIVMTKEMAIVAVEPAKPGKKKKKN